MPGNQAILIVSADLPVAQKCFKALSAFGFQELQIVDSMARARMELRLAQPAVVLLDESAIRHPREECSLESAVRELAAVAPVVLAAAYARLPEVASLMASGAVDFVARTGDFPRAAARLLSRHLGLRSQKRE